MYIRNMLALVKAKSVTRSILLVLVLTLCLTTLVAAQENLGLDGTVPDLTIQVHDPEDDAPVQAAGQAATFGNDFTYQGYLNEKGLPANGAYDFKYQFLGPNEMDLIVPISIEVILDDVAVTDGLFSLLLDGSSIFNGDARFLRLWVRPGDATDFTQIEGALRIRGVPYAFYADQAGELVNPGDTMVRVSPFDMIQSDGLTNLTFAAKFAGPLEVTRNDAPAAATRYVYVPVDVPSQVLGHQQQLKSLRFCYSGQVDGGLGILAGIRAASVREVNVLSGKTLLGQSFDTTLTGENECTTVEANTPQTVAGSLWIRFEITASAVPLQFGEMTLTFGSE